MGHYFVPNELSDEDTQKCILKIPADILSNLKQQKLIVAVKASQMGFFEKNLFKSEINFSGLLHKNEMSKKMNFEKVRFEVIVRIRRSLSGKEMTQEKTTKTVLDSIPKAFDVWQSEQAPKAKANPDEPPIITLAKEI